MIKTIAEARDFLRFRRNKVTSRVMLCGFVVRYRMDGVLYSSNAIIKIANDSE
jgi:hypothetical protein